MVAIPKVEAMAQPVVMREIDSPSSGTPAVMRTVGLTKVYHGRTVVNQVNLTVRPGEIYGFLGPNGAGKTTTIRMILGLVPPTHGQVEMFGQRVGHDHSELRQRVGVVGEQSFLYDDITARDYLAFFARLYGVHAKQGEALLERLGLAPFADLLARDFSQGMQRKLSIARALLHDPDVLVLDEPTSGLDPYGILQVRELLQEKRQAGRAIFVSSHILSEVERTADRVGIISRGRLVMEDKLKAVISQLTPGTWLQVEMEKPVVGIAEQLLQLEGIRSVKEDGSALVIEVDGDSDRRGVVSQTITAAQGVVIGMKLDRGSLEQAFVRLTEGELRAADSE
jgi:ABC-type multidrug transport system ATPase subunit